MLLHFESKYYSQLLHEMFSFMLFRENVIGKRQHFESKYYSQSLHEMFSYAL